MVNWDRLLAEAKSFFSSGLFYILLGGLIMYCGYRLSNDPFTHSALVFLVVILGLALLLFGPALPPRATEPAARSRSPSLGGPVFSPWFSDSAWLSGTRS
jgi:hypothetical protein